MKTLIRSAIFTSLTLYFVSRFLTGVSFSNTTVLIAAGVVLTLLTVFVKPFLKILLLPVNLITFGLFSWVINLIIIYLATVIVPGFSVGSITIPQIVIGPFLFPAFTLTTFWSFFFLTLLISIGNSILGLIL